MPRSMCSCAAKPIRERPSTSSKEAFTPGKVVVKEHLRGKEMQSMERWVEETLHRGFRVTSEEPTKSSSTARPSISI